MLTVMVVLASLGPSEKVSSERGVTIGWKEAQAANSYISTSEEKRKM